MRIAIDSGPLTSGHKVRGIGVHTRELIEELKKIKNSSVEIKVLDFKKVDFKHYDLVHFPYFHPFFPTLLDRPLNKKTVVTIHDLIQLIYPKQYQPGLKGRINFLKQKKAIKKTDGIITISETSKKDICRFLDVHPNKVRVIYLAPKNNYQKINDSERLNKVKEKYNLPNKFVLFVGDINYNKNIPTLIKACEKAKLPLVICGKQALDIEKQGIGLDVLQGPQDWIRFLFNVPHPELAHYQKLVDSFRGKVNIIRPGYVTDEELVAIYNLATVYCAPSFYEGFNLPLLEAMACELPVVASRVQAHVEIAQDAALYFDPRNIDELANKLKKVVKSENLRKILIDKGNEVLQKYSWKKAAKETLDFYKEIFNK